MGSSGLIGAHLGLIGFSRSELADLAVDARAEYGRQRIVVNRVVEHCAAVDWECAIGGGLLLLCGGEVVGGAAVHTTDDRVRACALDVRRRRRVVVGCLWIAAASSQTAVCVASRDSPGVRQRVPQHRDRLECARRHETAQARARSARPVIKRGSRLVIALSGVGTPTYRDTVGSCDRADSE